MFWKKKCKHCDTEIKDKWNFCSNCGVDLTGKGLDNSLAGFEKEIDKVFSMDSRFPKFRLKPHARSGGVSITITSGTGMQPKVEMKRSGEYKNLGHGIKSVGHHHHHTHAEEPGKEIKIPKVTVEPETKVQRLGNRQTITVNLPDVKEEDVQIRQLEQSIEIRALSGDKGYFKLIPVPANAYVGKEFKDGILKIEVVK